MKAEPVFGCLGRIGVALAIIYLMFMLMLWVYAERKDYNRNNEHIHKFLNHKQSKQ